MHKTCWQWQHDSQMKSVCVCANPQADIRATGAKEARHFRVVQCNCYGGVLEAFPNHCWICWVFGQVHPCRTTPLRASEDNIVKKCQRFRCIGKNRARLGSADAFCRKPFQLSTEISHQRHRALELKDTWKNNPLVECAQGELLVYELSSESTFGAMRDRNASLVYFSSRHAYDWLFGCQEPD